MPPKLLLIQGLGDVAVDRMQDVEVEDVDQNVVAEALVALEVLLLCLRMELDPRRPKTSPKPSMSPRLVRFQQKNPLRGMGLLQSRQLNGVPPLWRASVMVGSTLRRRQSL
jgi:hypothetical protein